MCLKFTQPHDNEALCRKPQSFRYRNEEIADGNLCPSMVQGEKCGT
jgi:hypothetical protein